MGSVVEGEEYERSQCTTEEVGVQRRKIARECGA